MGELREEVVPRCACAQQQQDYPPAKVPYVRQVTTAGDWVGRRYSETGVGGHDGPSRSEPDPQGTGSRRAGRQVSVCLALKVREIANLVELRCWHFAPVAVDCASYASIALASFETPLTDSGARFRYALRWL